MENKWSNVLLLGMVLLAHGAAVTVATGWHSAPSLPDTPPTISGVLVKAPPATKPQASATSQPATPAPKQEPTLSPSAEMTPVKPIPIKPTPTKSKPIPQPAPAQPERARIEPTTTAQTATMATPAAPDNSEGAPVTAPVLDAHHHQNAAPVYPKLSRRRGEEGQVMIELLVKKDGSVSDAHIKESSGYSRLDRSALEAVRNWKYSPATRGGKPIDFRYLQPVTFNLKR